MSSKKVLIIADDIKHLNSSVDSTVFLIQEAWKRGFDVWLTRLQNLTILQSSKSHFLTKASLVEHGEDSNWYKIKLNSQVDIYSFNYILIRVDPPFDVNYLVMTQLLSFAEDKGVTVVNSPKSLRNFNEKLFALRFPEFTPATLVSSDFEEIYSFLETKNNVVFKPLNLMGGQGIFVCNKGDHNIKTIIQTLTKSGMEKIVVQEFIENISNGDKRIIIINGIVEKFALCRIPEKNSYISNLAAGGIASVVELDQEEFEIANEIASQIKKEIFFAGIDLIDKKLTEINITSPTGMRQIASHSKAKLNDQFFDLLEKI
jgi:glutathione synthase